MGIFRHKLQIIWSLMTMRGEVKREDEAAAVYFKAGNKQIPRMEQKQGEVGLY
jgi:hypothetical protein